MGAAQAAENHGDESGLTQYLQRDIYAMHQFQPELTHKNSLAAAETSNLKISSLISQVITKIIPVSMRMAISYAMKWDVLF